MWCKWVGVRFQSGHCVYVTHKQEGWQRSFLSLGWCSSGSNFRNLFCPCTHKRLHSGIIILVCAHHQQVLSSYVLFDVLFPFTLLVPSLFILAWICSSEICISTVNACACTTIDPQCCTKASLAMLEWLTLCDGVPIVPEERWGKATVFSSWLCSCASVFTSALRREAAAAVENSCIASTDPPRERPGHLLEWGQTYRTHCSDWLQPVCKKQSRSSITLACFILLFFMLTRMKIIGCLLRWLLMVITGTVVFWQQHKFFFFPTVP